MRSLSDTIRKLAKSITAQPDPNADPGELFKQVRPLLVKMGIVNMVDRMKTRLEPGQTQKNNSLYCILLRRNAELLPDTIERLRRNNEFFRSIKWTSKALEVYVWYPYTAPATETPAAPKPGVPPAATPIAPR
jgi:hypothetical protein